MEMIKFLRQQKDKRRMANVKRYDKFASLIVNAPEHKSLDYEVWSLASKVKCLCNDLLDGGISATSFTSQLDGLNERAKDSIRRHDHTADAAIGIHSPAQGATVERDMIRYAGDEALYKFLAKHKLVLPHSDYPWYSCADQEFGTIPGLEKWRGRPRISNGVLVYIEREDGEILLGHMQYFRSETNLEPVAGLEDVPNPRRKRAVTTKKATDLRRAVNKIDGSKLTSAEIMEKLKALLE